MRVMKVVVVRYGEIALKSTPVRSRFERLLLSNVQKMVEDLGRAYRSMARIVVETEFPSRVCRIVSKIPGVVSCSPALRTSSDLEDIVKVSLQVAKAVLKPGESFAVRASREGKHSFTSIDVNRIVGREILSSVPNSRVDLSNPDREIFIEIRGAEAYIYARKIGGVGGLPVGSQGTVVSLFEGSRRDLRASFLVMKRGCGLNVLTWSRNLDQARKLLVHHHSLDAFILPASLSLKISKTPAGLRPIVRRRVLLRIGGELARRTGSASLVVSDGLDFIRKFGLKTLHFVDEAAGQVPVLRPLLGEDLLKAGRKRIEAREIPKQRVMELEERILPNVADVLNSIREVKL